MGITAFSISLIEKALAIHRVNEVMELGSQNLYDKTYDGNPPFASQWYAARGIKYNCIDLGGDNNAMRIDLGRPLNLRSVEWEGEHGTEFKSLSSSQYDLVTDFGTSEHIVYMEDWNTISTTEGTKYIKPFGDVDADYGFYNCICNKHKLLKKGGICISENPKRGSWPGHGYSYYTEEFYTHLCRLMEYELIKLGIHAALGNTIDGWNVYCIFRKTKERQFLTREEFEEVEQFIYPK